MTDLTAINFETEEEAAPKPDPNLPTFFAIDDIKRDIEAMENNEAAWTPEWMTAALMSVWQDGQLKGNTDGYFGTSTARNPFMTEREQRAYYE